MYLTKARVAHQDGYPEIGDYWVKTCLEETEHAARFTELKGEVIADSTKKNLKMRLVNENGIIAAKLLFLVIR